MLFGRYVEVVMKLRWINSGGSPNFATKIQRYKVKTRESGKESLKEFRRGEECAR